MNAGVLAGPKIGDAGQRGRYQVVDWEGYAAAEARVAAGVSRDRIAPRYR